MRCDWRAAALAVAVAAAGDPAYACVVVASLDPADVKLADVVVIARIANYSIVLDEKVRRERKESLARMSPALRESLASQTTFLSDYARFDLLVDKVLVGPAPKTLSVTWDNSTFGEPEAMPPGEYLVALRYPGSRSPPLRGPSATILPNPEPGRLTVLQAPCAPAFIFPSASAQATAVRKLLPGRPRR
jgi:hypothetical protein